MGHRGGRHRSAGGAAFHSTFLTGTSTYQPTLYDTPGGIFNINTPAAFTVLDTKTLTGTPTPDGLTFGWSHHVVSFNAAAATDGRVTLLVDLTAGGFSSFDNLLIEASDTPAGVPEPSILLLLGSGFVALRARTRRRRPA